MFMEGRRLRRFGGRQRRHGNHHTVLPLFNTHTSNSLSCWYCEFKSTALNEPLFRLGRRYSRFLRVWFSMGIGFALAAVFGVTMILLGRLAGALNLYKGNAQLTSSLMTYLFGSSSLISGMEISLPDFVYVSASSILSVFVHELGHALAASSEGVRVEHIAMFIAVLFPGALVAFNYELLQSLPSSASLRIYCAGIWHNASLCAACAMTLLLLPTILYPFYMYERSLMVLGVAPMSPLSAYLSARDIIISVDGIRVQNAEEWRRMTTLVNKHAVGNSDSFMDSIGTRTVNRRKGYCIPSPLIEGSLDIELKNNHTTCPDNLTPLLAVSCVNSSVFGHNGSEINPQAEGESIICLNPKDIVKHRRCSDGSVETPRQTSRCQCLMDESCFAPVQMPGRSWVEIRYSSPFSSDCSQPGTGDFPDRTSNIGEMNCLHTFVFIGDVASIVHSVHVTSYRPRWFLHFGAYIPNVLEKLLACTFHVSMILALLNSFPVYYLDGESVLEVALNYLKFLSPRKRGLILQCCLLGGTLVSAYILLQIFLVLVSSYR